MYKAVLRRTVRGNSGGRDILDVLHVAAVHAQNVVKRCKVVLVQLLAAVIAGNTVLATCLQGPVVRGIADVVVCRAAAEQG